MTDGAPQGAIPPTQQDSLVRPIKSARAGFWPRFGALFLDCVLIGIVNTILFGTVFASLGSTPEYALSTIVALAYFTLLEGGLTGQTLGKMAFGIQVLDRSRASLIGYPRALVRYLAQILSAIPLFLGYFWMIWDPNKQCWHDKLADSVVVPVEG